MEEPCPLTQFLRNVILLEEVAVAKILIAALALALALPATTRADVASALSDLQGYTVVGTMTITGWVDRSNGKKGDDFEGCEFDRVIILDDSKVLTCATYSYTYSYRPRAVILVNGSRFKMIVGDRVYDMRRE